MLIGQQFGLVLLFVLMSFALYNDLSRIFGYMYIRWDEVRIGNDDAHGLAVPLHWPWRLIALRPRRSTPGWSAISRLRARSGFPREQSTTTCRMNIGDTVTDQRVQESIRALYSTGFFQDVEFRRNADTLVIAVLERPSIEEFTIEGNDEIKTEDLEESLRQVGLTRGKVFDQSVLEEVRQFLLEQYYSRGRYGVSVETPVEENRRTTRVRVGIEIEEGARAKIRQVNLVGNTSFTDREILRGLRTQHRELVVLYQK